MYTHIYHRTGVHIYATDREVIRALRPMLREDVRKGREHRVPRHDIIRNVLREHHDARQLAADFRL